MSPSWVTKKIKCYNYLQSIEQKWFTKAIKNAKQQGLGWDILSFTNLKGWSARVKVKVQNEGLSPTRRQYQSQV